MPAVEEAVAWGGRCARFFLPRGQYAKHVAVSLVRDVARLAAERTPAAEALFPFLPRILLARGIPIEEQAAALMARRVATQPPLRPAVDPMDAYCRRLRVALESGDPRAVCMQLDRGPQAGRATEQEARQVLETKFPVKPAGELPVGRSEGDWVAATKATWGGGRSPMGVRDLLGWARRKRGQAPDAGGWSGQLILQLNDADRDVTRAIAALWSKAPEEWAHAGGAEATWRLLRGALIPQPGKLPRPIAIASVGRRAWTAVVSRRILPIASRYCLQRGQFGLAGARGQTAYCLTARVLAELGGDVAVYDRSNSFHELHRSAILSGVDAFAAGLAREEAESAIAPLIDVLERNLADGARGIKRTTFVLRDAAPVTNHALCQGSPEASLLEALTYAQGGWRNVPGGVICELHDDGFAAVLPGADVEGLRRPAPTDGSRPAEKKDRCVGPRAADLVRQGLSREAARVVSVAGVPVGDTMEGLREWRGRYELRLRRIREVAAFDLAIASQVVFRLGGPAGVAGHLLRALPPRPELLAFWREVDDLWVEMWLDVLRLDGEERRLASSAVRDRCGLVKGACGFRGRFAAEFAEVRYAEAVGAAASLLEKVLVRAGVEMSRRVWEALGVDGWAEAGQDWTAKGLEKAAADRAQVCYAAIDRSDGRRHARVMKMERGARESCGAPNLLVAWASTTPGEATARLRTEDALVALRRLFGLPLPGPPTHIDPPRICARCGAAVSSGETVDVAAGPRRRVDPFGEHALTCALARGQTQRRHDELAAAVRRCLDDAGWDGAMCGGPVWESHGGRPADVWARRHPTYLAGLAIDVTVVTTSGRPPGKAAEAAEAAKRKKYAVELAKAPAMGFAPFAIDLGGGIGPSAWSEMQAWATAIAAREGSSIDRGQALEQITGRLANAFVRGITRQIRAFEIGQSRDAHGARGRAHP